MLNWENIQIRAIMLNCENRLQPAGAVWAIYGVAAQKILTLTRQTKGIAKNETTSLSATGAVDTSNFLESLEGYPGQRIAVCANLEPN